MHWVYGAKKGKYKETLDECRKHYQNGLMQTTIKTNGTAIVTGCSIVCALGEIAGIRFRQGHTFDDENADSKCRKAETE